MKKRLLTLLLCTLLSVQSIGILSVKAAREDIPENAEEIKFDTRYRAEPGEVRWHRFVAPSPQCYFTDMKVEQLGDYLYGRDVTAHRYYDSEGNELGTISSTNDPDVSEWTEFEVGKTYYIKVMAQENGTFYTLSPVRTKEPTVDADIPRTGSISLELTEEGLSRFFAGHTNTTWDAYTVTQTLNTGKDNVVTASDYFVLPYKIHFDDATMTGSTYVAVDKSAQDNWDSLKSYEEKPYSGKAEGYVYSANFYSYVTETEAAAQRSYKVYVPSGKRLTVGKDGCIYPLEINERFTDVHANAWYTDAIEWCAEERFMNGTANDKFSPSTPLTRAQFVMILANMEDADLNAYKDLQSFSDVPKGRWFSAAVEWAKDKGVTSGVSENRFAPNDPVTRQQLARFLCTYADLNDIPLAEGGSLEGFTDKSKVADWAIESMERAVSSGLISGMTETTLAPRNNATRAQISLIIKKFYESYMKYTVPSVAMGNYLLEGGTCGYSFYDELITLSGKENPHVLYIGMAGIDETTGWDAIKSEMCTWRGCTTDILLLEDLPTDTARQKIEAADIIYVTGGDSRMLLERLRHHGTDSIIREAAAKGTVMSGSSAGAICFGAYGTSGIRDDRFENLYGTGCVDVIVCPHGNEQKRVEEMKKLLLEDATFVGVAVDYACLEISGGMYRIYTEEGYHKPGTGIRYRNENGEIISEDINTMEWRPLEELINSEYNHA